MKLLYNFFIILFLTNAVFARQTINNKPKLSTQCVRTCEVTSSGGLRITASDDTRKKWVTSDEHCVISCKKNKLYINGKGVKGTSLNIESPKKQLFLNDSLVVDSATIHAHSRNRVRIIALHDNESTEKTITEHESKNIHSHTSHANNITKSDKAISKMTTSPVVRVLLDQTKKGQQQTWKLTSEGGFDLCHNKNAKAVFKHNKNELTIWTKDGIVRIGGKRVIASECIIIPKSEYIYFNNKSYKGSFLLCTQKGQVNLINCIDLEEYTYAVVRSESWPGWPLEVNKAFAIASRSYVMSMMARAVQAKQIYHIKDTNVHQRYNLYGEHSDPLIKRAVQETAGMCLVFNNQPILAMFDSCCGGIIPAHVEHFNFDEAPYLKRTYPCTFCKSSSLYSWQVTYDKVTFERMVNQVCSIKPVKDVHVHKKDKAGLAKEIILKSNKKQIILPGKRLYSLAKEIKSCYYTIISKAHAIQIKGRGLGHLLGLCQWGARQMVREGWNYKSVLKFYYPGADLKRLT